MAAGMWARITGSFRRLTAGTRHGRRGIAFVYAAALAGGGSVVSLSVVGGDALWTSEAMIESAATRMVATADDLPARVLLVSRRNLQPGQAIASNVVRLSGITVPVGVAVAGGEVSVANRPFTSAPTFAHRGDAIVLRTLAPAAGQSATVTLTTGQAVSDWVVASAEQPGHTHQTLYGPWGACSAAAPCDGLGNQSRELLCLRSDGRFVPVTDCAAGLTAIETRSCPSPAGTSACVPTPPLAIGAPTQYCAAGSSVRGPCGGFTCPAPYAPQNGACVSERQSLPVLSVALPATAREEGGPVRLTVTADYPALQALTLPISLDPASQADGQDLAGGPWSVTLPVGQTQASIDLALEDDQVSEPDETLVLRVGAPAGGATLAPGSAIVSLTIIDDDTLPQVTVTSAQDRLTEGGSTTLTVSLSRDSARTITVPLLATGPGADEVTLTPGTVVFAPRQRVATVSLAAADDLRDELDEAVTIAAHGLDAAAAVAGTGVTVTILDDDQIPTVALAPASLTVTEGGAAVSLTVGLSAATWQDVAVALEVTGAAGDLSLPAGVTVPAGETSVVVPVAAIDDPVHEDVESAAIAVAVADPAVAVAGAGAAVTILDDEALPTVSLDPVTLSVTEGAPAATVTLRLDRATWRDVAVTLGVSGAAGDVSVPAGAVIPAGATSATVGVTAIDDLLHEPAETVTLSLMVTDPATAAAGSGSVVTVLDNEGVPTLALAPATLTVTEGAAAATLSVSLERPTWRDVVVGLAVTGAAAEVSVPASVTIPAGAVTATATIAAIDDPIHEAAKAATVALGAVTPAGAAAPGPAATTAVTIADNEPLPALSLALVAGASLDESAGTVPVRASLDRVSDRDLPLAVAFSSDDIALVGPAPVIVAGTTAVTFTVAAVPDILVEGAETVTISLAAVPGRASASPAASLTLTVVDDDSASLSASADVAPATRVTRSWTLGASAQPVVLSVSGSDGSPRLSTTGGSSWATTATVSGGTTVQLAVDAPADFAGSRTVTILANGSAYTWQVSTPATLLSECAAILAAHPATPDGDYTVSLPGLGATRVTCDQSGGGWTLIPHDKPGELDIKALTGAHSGNAEPPRGKLAATLDYRSATGTALSYAAVAALVETASEARQRATMRCYHAATWHSAEWYNYIMGQDGTAARYPNDQICDVNDSQWRTQDGDVTERAALPVRTVWGSDVDASFEQAHVTIGPLRLRGLGGRAARDRTPAGVANVTLSGVELGGTVTRVFSPTSFDGELAVRVSGPATAQVADPSGMFTTGWGLVRDGQSFTVRLTAPTTLNASAVYTVTIGTVTATVTVRTDGYPASCQAIRDANPSAANGVYRIDPDGASTAIPAFRINCLFNRVSGQGWAEVRHDREAEQNNKVLTGSHEGNSSVPHGKLAFTTIYRDADNTTLSRAVMNAWINRATQAEQHLRKHCNGSVAWQGGNFYAFWIGSDGARGVWPNSSACDTNDAVWRVSEGLITIKGNLPIHDVYDGDLGSAGEQSRVTVGILYIR